MGGQRSLVERRLLHFLPRHLEELDFTLDREACFDRPLTDLERSSFLTIEAACLVLDFALTGGLDLLTPDLVLVRPFALLVAVALPSLLFFFSTVCFVRPGPAEASGEMPQRPREISTGIILRKNLILYKYVTECQVSILPTSS